MDALRLALRRQDWQAMRQDVLARLPQEACGFLAGLGGVSTAVLPVNNALASPQRFRMQPQEQVRAWQEIERQGWQVLAIYHSHPQGPAWPSPTDLAEAYDPEVRHLIWAPADDWQCRAFWLCGGVIEPLEWLWAA